MAKLTREQTADGIMRLAVEAGVADNAIFKKTLERYLTLQNILDNYEKSMEEDGLEVKKEYVKGRGNLYASPAAKEYPKILDCSNKTAATLMRIIKNFSESANDRADKKDDLMAAINGGDDYGEETD